MNICRRNAASRLRRKAGLRFVRPRRFDAGGIGASDQDNIGRRASGDAAAYDPNGLESPDDDRDDADDDAQVAFILAVDRYVGVDQS